MDQKNPMEVLTDADLMEEFKVNKNFIARNSKGMGSRGRPRRFLRMNVERFFALYFTNRLMESLAKKADALRQAEFLDNLNTKFFHSTAVSHIGMGKILPKGGRQKRVAA